ncbi:outer spore wall assembly protein SHE10-like [Solanum stenotomum]|uniref:outer spore wall assembly protein SHE10-like n=1 Tax=Solanum stenotomum TaxID=172797 RepID=UPI0020D05BC2|nr:outer spore wall assembly protein SHE10-like [Solanum stenotomum]
MKLTKSMLSPSHARHDPPLTLPTSLSRRLKANGSIKGGQSPATFPTTTGKKRGSGFDNPEPSSPKVTCIGQVKMKTKKKVRQTRNLSNRRSDISFRKLEEERGVLIQNQRSSSVHLQAQDQCAAAVAVAHRNQRWVHLPVTIYEALRELSCLFPCRSSCFSNEKGKQEDKVNGSREVDNNNGQRRCEDVVARWLVALQDGEADDKTRGIELVVTNNVKEEEDEKMEEMQSTMRSSRRHVFEGIEFKDHDDGSVEMKEEKARVSICIPPKNALLLMRCRSDPMKMADITNRFWESPARKETNEEVEVDEKEIGENADVEELVDTENTECKVLEETSCVSVDLVENEENAEAESSKDEEKLKCHGLTPETEEQGEEESVIKALVAAVAVEVNSIVDETNNQLLESEKKEEEDSSIQSFSSFSENEEDETLDEEQEEERFKSIIKKVIEETLLLEHIDRADAKQIQHEHREEEEAKSDAAFSNNEIEKESRKQQNESILPDCLLLMMCEPKLSMEVSKETWVYSSTELKQAKTVTKKKKNEIPEDPKRRRSIDKSKQQRLLQPPRSSCSFPATGVSPAMSMATMIEQKLVNSVAYEPLVLTRCKSEPMRTAAGVTAKLVPETCFWKNMKIEPHRRATFGFGAAGVGF